MAPTKTREKVARPDDRAWVGATTRKRGNTAMKRNYDFGRDCRTTSLHFFYNPIHDFWDGSGYVPPGQSLPKNLQEIVEDILRRQVVSDDKLVLQPARQRKQLCKDKPAQNRPVKEKPYRVTKPRDARRPVPLPTPRALSLRSRAGSANSRAVAAASPIHSQITVADDEVEVDGGEAGMWDVPDTPIRENTRRQRTQDSICRDTQVGHALDIYDDNDGADDDDDNDDNNNNNDDDDDDNNGGGGDDKDDNSNDNGDNNDDVNIGGAGIHVNDECNNRNRDGNAHRYRQQHLTDGPELRGVSVNRSRRSDQSWAPSYTPASSPFVVEQNADCEPCERPVAPFAPMEGEANGEVDDGIDDTVFFPQSSNETPPVVDFTTMMVGDTWTNSNAVDFPGMAAFPDMMDFDMGNFDMDNFDLSLDLNLDGMDQLDHFETSPHRAGFSVTYPEASPSYDLTEAPGKQDNHEPVVPDVRAAGESPSSPGAAATTAEHRSPKAPPRPTSSSRPAGDRASPTSRPPNIQAGLEPSDGSATESRDQEQPPRRVAWNQQLITVLAETFREMSVHQEMRWDRPGDVDLSMGSRHQIATPLMMSAF
ncbi:hypothetical protein FOTG_18747 [Fusarium oxysporum f. sp. vasinfectum 25433]|uniref:Uncharacterized protein n=1 Tax=Fusarium oxysporum f. sp. vasinfectum 25433 TaxID=1089449 RepID=X0LWA4_FUSOX|nr:hypothetical protein FOTG_18747 [Fusarium oxysporum f. sp. vasinfectum 25433]